MEKSGSYNESDKKLHYELTVSTTKGTGGAITVNDSFGVTNTHATYDKDSFQIVKVDAEGNETTVTGYTPTITNDGWEGAPEKFTITGLPALGEGERYHITYTATPGKTNDALGASNVNNSVNVTTEGGNNSNGWNEVIISHSMLSKGGYYDAAAGVIKWTITLNPDKKDIGGWKLTDNVTAQNGVTVTMPQKVNISPAVNGQSEITLPYTFPEGSSDSYTITYETKVEGLQPGEQAQVTNKAEFDGGDEHYEQGSTVYPSAPDYNVSKSAGWHDPAQDDGDSGTYPWNASITVPPAFDENSLESITYTDTLIDAATGGHPVEGSHYITGQQLSYMTVSVNGTTLTRNKDYIICDKDGNEITDFTDQKHYTGFQIKFQKSVVDIVRGQTINMQYSTTVDYTKLDADIIYTIRNIGAIPGHEGEGSTTYEKPSKLEKQASVTQQNGSYTNNGITIDYEESQGIIHYRLLVHTDASTKGNIIITDLLPKGASLVNDSVKMAFYENDYYEYGGINLSNGGQYSAADHIHTAVGTTNEEGTTPVTFTIDDGYNGNGNFNTLAVYYDVSIAEDEIWDDPSTGQHIYTNHASWGDNSTSTDVTVDREVPTLAKTGAQLPQLDANGEPMKDTQGNPVLSNTVRYYVTINQAAQDLDPVQDNLKLTDKLNLPANIAGADLNVGSVHLYHFDMNEENHCGQEINPARYSYTYDSTSHTMTFTVPDSTAMVLVYEYTIDRGSAAGNLQLSNSVELTGVDDSKIENQVQFQETSSSATVSKRTLTIYKVDGENYGTTLPGAEFKLDSFNVEKNSWNPVNNNLVSDEKGQIVLDQTDDNNAVYQLNVLYRLTETEAPTGYAKDETPHYFVWVESGKTVDACKMEMQSILQQANVDANDVLFISNSSAIYVPNQSTTLKVEKVWLDEDGVELPNPNVGELEVKLYQNTTRTNGVTVTVNWRDQYDNGETVSVQVKDGSSLTIDTGIWNSSYTYSVNHGPETSITSNELTLTITGDTVVDLKTPYRAAIAFSNYEQPSYVQTGEKELHNTVTLNKDNNWSYTWTDLPTTDNDGAPVYYTV